MANDAEAGVELRPDGIHRRYDLANDLVLPTMLFAALGGMTWAVRGCSGFGAVAGCVFAGVMWGAAWWFIAQASGGARARRYNSGWIVLALTVGIGLSGARGWMQWPSFFEGKLMTDAPKGQYVPIPRAYGFLWLFIAGVPWAGIGACLLAWCGSRRETRAWHWIIRIACGLGGALLVRHLVAAYPQHFLPLYESLGSRYRDYAHNPSLRRLTNDCGAALTHLGCYLGLLLYEVARREWKNTVLIVTVGLINGAGWALCQNWKWANAIWGSGAFNFWRCWESSGGISIGIAYGIAYFLVNREMSGEERAAIASRRSIAGPNFEWLFVFTGLAWLLVYFLGSQLGGWGHLYLGLVVLTGAAYVLLKRGSSAEEGSSATPHGHDDTLERLGLYLGLLTGLGLSIRNGLKGWFNIYVGNEDYWGRRLWDYLGPTYLVCLAAIAVWVLLRPQRPKPVGARFPHAYGPMWLVLVVQNAIAQLVTGPLRQWNEMAFSLYYLLLFFISAVIVLHYEAMRRRTAC
jgi:hypothetical protein